MRPRSRYRSYHRRFAVDTLEERVMLTVAGAQIVNLQTVGSRIEAVSINVAAPVTSSNSLANGAPVATGVTAIRYDKSGADYRLSLTSAFDDPDGFVTDLVFAVTDSGDPIFESLTMDASTGELLIDFVDNVTGGSLLTVTATDADGNLATTEIGLEVDQLGESPGLDSFSVSVGIDGNRVFSGTVELNGRDSSELDINFGGDLDGYTTTVNSDGTFVYVAEATDYVNATGIVTAQVVTDLGETSNILFVSLDD